MCVCVCLRCFLAWPCGPAVDEAAAALVIQGKKALSHSATHALAGEKEKRHKQRDGRRISVSLSQSSSVAFIFLPRPRVIDPTLCLLASFRQKSWFHTRRFHSL